MALITKILLPLKNVKLVANSQTSEPVTSLNVLTIE